MGDTHSDSWASNTAHNYGFYHLDTTTGGPSRMHIAWQAQTRPNRFSVKNESTGAIVATSGWVGTAAYAGPWGSTLSAATTGTLTFWIVAGNLYSLQVEAGNGNPAAPATDTWQVTVSCDHPVSGAITLSCSDGGCSHQGETNIHFAFSPATPAALTILFGEVISGNGGTRKFYTGSNIFTHPSGTEPNTYYGDYNVPFTVSVGSGQTSVNVIEPISQQAGSTSNNDWICHSCLNPVTDLYVQILTAGYTANFTVTNVGTTIHNT